MKKSRSVQMIQQDLLIAVVMIASRSAMKIVPSDFRNTIRTEKSYKFLATYDFGFVICNACWWWRWIPAVEDTTNWDDGVTIGEPSIHSIGLLFGFYHSRFLTCVFTYFKHLTRKKSSPPRLGGWGWVWWGWRWWLCRLLSVVVYLSQTWGIFHIWP